MANKMLIDAAHEEETRVVVTRGNRVEEFDFEAANRKQLRGNIYLAKVTRVEPSLQAAFVDYGGNRHGFLAFSEIHPDYYQIPFADRQALLAEEAEDDDHRDNGSEAVAESQADAAQDSDGEEVGNEPTGSVAAAQLADDSVSSDPVDVDSEAVAEDAASNEADGDDADRPVAENGGDAGSVDAAPETAHPEHGLPAENDGGVEDIAEEDEQVESVGAEDAMEEVPVRRQFRRRRNYKIQEVIKRRQILLVQVVKEERGNKGAALTTYLSIAGRYCVLMPNTARGGGISRKITNATDRRRLKQVAEDLELPKGMGVILRTAGASRTKAEVKRDFEYLLRLWENVRELTLRSTAPTLVYEEGSLIKRAIRDLYSKEINEILVAGDEGYKEAKTFMRMLMPSHAKNVQPYKEPEPIFSRHNVESQLDAMFSPQVTLRSGGYIVLNQTEALVAIDVNSGRSTREHNIEDTALSTNLEAAEEIARQLRLRDLAGLIVIDFIDMDEKRNKRAIERKLKECLRHDRARIQVGHISHFGLLEMSRQRIRAGVLEGSTIPCPHCQGTGTVRSVESVALHVLRAIEEALQKGKPANITARTNAAAALYILNQKRDHLRALEDQFGVTITVEADDKVVGAHPAIERGEPVARPERVRHAPVHLADDSVDIDDMVDEEDEDETADAVDAEADDAKDDADDERRGRRRRRRRRGGRGRDRDLAERDEQKATDDAGPLEDDEETEGEDSSEPDETDAEARSSEQAGQRDGKRRRRGKRGGRNRRERNRSTQSGDNGDAGLPADEDAQEEGDAPALAVERDADDSDRHVAAEVEREAEPVESFFVEPRQVAEGPADEDEPGPAAMTYDAAPEEPADDDEREPQPSTAHDGAAEETVVPSSEPARPPRVGWWRRRA